MSVRLIRWSLNIIPSAVNLTWGTEAHVWGSFERAIMWQLLPIFFLRGLYFYVLSEGGGESFSYGEASLPLFPTYCSRLMSSWELESAAAISAAGQGRVS